MQDANAWRARGARPGDAAFRDGVQGGAPGVDPDLLWRWLAARSIAHGLPLPVPDHGGMRVDTMLAHETRRHVFAGPCDGLRALAASVRAPRVFLKMCGTGEALLALAPPGWALQPPAYLMIQADAGDTPHAPGAGYRIEAMRQGLVTSVRIRAPDGTVAASGHAAEYRGVFVFDRIATHAAHRRRGLGRALMAALGARQQSAARRVLVATAEGRALYETLGWRVVSPYATIVIPG
jgi:GNAT superfamily N-acetyltransferase